ncbi:MAG TPA: hypothetical protein DHU75_01640 [Rikenellaceae bacterium]|nr:hypothetical protein [Rikenellaceae bacterium]
MKIKHFLLSIFLVLSVWSNADAADIHITDIALLISNDNYSKAKPLAQKLVKAEPDNDAGWYYLGRCLWVEGNYKKAIGCFQRSVKLDPTNDNYYLTLYNAISQFPEMEAQADSIALQLIKRFPKKFNTPFTLMLLAENELKAKKDSLATIHLQQALALDPTYAPAALELSEIYRTEGNLSAYFVTIPIFLTDRDLPPTKKADYLWNVLELTDGTSYRIYGKRLDSLVDTLLTTHPKDSSCIKLAGNWAIYTSRPELAKKHFETLTEYYPETLTGWGALSYLSIDEKEKISIYEKALSHIKVNTDRAALYSMMADSYYRLGEKKKSYQCFDKALKLCPNDATILNNYAYNLCLDGKNLKKAEKMSMKAVKMEPENASFLDTYGWILYQKKDYEKAKSYFKKCMVYGGSNSKESLYHYSKTLEALGEKDLADFYMNMYNSK